MKGQNKLFIAIIVALIVGVVMGGIVHTQYPESSEGFAQNIKLLGTVFIRLVQMIIAPLVFTTLVVGIAKMSDIKMIGRVGTKAMLWFITASLVSLMIGLVFVNWLEPGKVMQLPIPAAGDAGDVVANSQGLSLEQFVKHIIPKSLFEAFATNEVLQIVVFSIMFGVALANMGEEYTKPIVRALDICAHAILKMVGYIMWFAPLGVLGAIAAVVATNGFDIFKVYAIYLRDFFFALAILWLVLLIVGYLILGNRLFELLRRIKAPLLIAFSTTSSEAVFPKLVEELERFGCNNRIVSFILPLGYSFNLDGSMMYMTFAAIFIAQIYGIDMTLGQQITMLLVLMLTSKGIAGVPRASLVIIVATCTMFGIPPEGIALILPIDHFCDMGRSMTNVLGNALATSSVSKWEGQLDDHGGDL
ncbi:dicarboxylate/amino acid:cation symporter [Chryseobacterium sp. HSC-36S06]|uniref:dicarboxylate/amino acid:cation symporter n=1 Tax=Chryseobacterium sp. HSC-36S06 TaxID=2910970 RepID=UPI00209D7496|nr:cation:dicarboxylase symporter family transporter [Chryseobacterium sp. HSC-36S06]MCP2037591.1 Na+/H+-dicarboxylate symporter [Chryseobacterium sp. HSC-36S06]